MMQSAQQLVLAQTQTQDTITSHRDGAKEVNKV